MQTNQAVELSVSISKEKDSTQGSTDTRYVKLFVRMMFGTLLILIFVNFSVGFHIKDGETYQGFTVFDDKQGNYLRIKGKFFINMQCIGRSNHLE